MPVHVSRSDAFDDLVLAAVERLEKRWSAELAGVDIVVVEVPPPHSDPRQGAHVLSADIPLGHALPATPARGARLVVYRRPVLLRAGDQLPRLVHEVVVEQVAALLGLPPQAVDPGYGT